MKPITRRALVAAIYSKAHFVVSLAVAAVVVAVLGGAPLTTAVALVAGGGALGVLVDLDHFLIARLRTGSWAALRFVARNPAAAVVDQRAIFDEGEVGKIPRLLSHVVIAGVVVGGLLFVDAHLALLAAAVLYSHLLCDLVADLRDLRRAGDL